MKAKHLFHTLLASAMLAATTGLTTACTSNDDNPATPSGPSESVIKEKILGKWKRVKEDGEERVTNNRVVLTYFADGKMTYSRSSYSDYWTGYKWYNENPFTYVVSGNVVTREGVEENGRVRKTFEEVAVLSDSEMKLICTGYLMDGQSYSRYKVNEFKRVAVDYSEDIIGTWEGVEMTGDETYGNADARIAYLPDGTYRYYQKNDRGEWEVKAGQEVSEYNVDGDWLATRWQEKGGEMNYEWWDIDEIKDGQMKWSALREREDGTRFTTTFTWRKVEAPAGVEAVDLGLPSGIKWANMNLGAEAPEDHGLYFAWGETVGIDIESEEERVFDWDSYKWSNGSSTTMTKYCTEGIHYSYDGRDYYFGTVDNKTELDPEDDAAYVNWGTEWRMPKVEDIMELLNNTTSEWTMQNGVDGRRFTGANGNSIFLPVTGYIDGVYLYGLTRYGHYHSASLWQDYPWSAQLLTFWEKMVYPDCDLRRNMAYPVRPVQYPH